MLSAKPPARMPPEIAAGAGAADRGGAADVVGVLLAGGQARRMGGGDKPLQVLAGQPLLDHVLARIGPQVNALVLNANGDPARFAGYGLAVEPDLVPGHAGPLAGVLTGLAWARTAYPQARWLLSAPTDSPFLPRDLVARLRAAVTEADADLACASSGGRDHPVFGLWPLGLYADLYAAVVDEGVRKIDAFTSRYCLARASYASEPVDPFFNANRPEDLSWAESVLAEDPSLAG